VKIYSWTARRAGGAITVSGKRKDGNAVKLVGVETITTAETDEGEITVAVMPDGVKHELACNRT
jgi:hypothetical protein